MEKYYLINELTNSQGQDGSTISVFSNEDPEKAKSDAIVNYHNTLAAYHNASDVLYAIVQIHDGYGRVLGGYSEIVDHRPETNE